MLIPVFNNEQIEIFVNIPRYNIDNVITGKITKNWKTEPANGKIYFEIELTESWAELKSPKNFWESMFYKETYEIKKKIYLKYFESGWFLITQKPQFVYNTCDN